MTDSTIKPYGVWGVNGQWMHNKDLGISEDEQHRRNISNGFIVGSDDVHLAAKDLIYRLADTEGDRKVKKVLIMCLNQIAQNELDNDYLNAIIDGSWDTADEIIFRRREKRANNPLGKPEEPITLEIINEKLDRLLRNT